MVDNLGRPLKGALVDLRGGEAPRGRGDDLWLVKTDSAGRFYFDSAQVDGYIRVRSLGYLTYIRRTSLRQPDARVTIHLRRDREFERNCTRLCDLLYGRASLTRLSKRQRVARPAYRGDAPDLEVYRAVLDSVYSIRGASPKMIVLGDSTFGFIRPCWKMGPCQMLPPHRYPIDSSLMAGLHEAIYRGAATGYADPMPALRARLPIVYQSEADRDEIFRIGAELGAGPYHPREHDLEAYTRAFTQLYPGAWGTIWLSRVAYDSARSQALVQIWHRCGDSCTSAEVIYLRHQSGAWKIWERMSISGYNDEGWNTAPLRYIGENAWREVDIARRRDSTRRARADSIASLSVPRRIHGVITDSKSHQPIPYAVVAVHSGYDDKVAIVRADKNGRFRVINPPLGGTMLEIRCPGAKWVRSQPGVIGDNRAIALPGLYVRPALDTTVNVAVPSLAVCSEPLRIEREPKKIATAGPPKRPLPTGITTAR